jgi:MFS family permease
MGQRLGARLRLLLAGGALAVALSFAYLLFLDTESGYADGLLPAFLLRGLGIGLVMSTSSLAVMSAVPLARSGLASGTLTMFRQAGTAVGVALMGALFVHHIHTDLPPRLESLPASEAAATEAAAEHFIPAGTPEAQAAASESIVEGFILLAAAGIVLSVTAAGAAAFVRYRSADEPALAVPASVQGAEPRPLSLPPHEGEPAAIPVQPPAVAVPEP